MERVFTVAVTQPAYPHPHGVPCPFAECNGKTHVDARTPEEKANWPHPVFEDQSPEEQERILKIARGEIPG